MSPKKTTSKSTKKTSSNKKMSPEETKKKLLEARKRKATPSIFKIKSKKNTPIVFSLDDVKELLDNKDKKDTPKKTSAKKTAPTTSRTVKEIPKELQDFPTEKRILGAASLSDILGFNPADTKNRPAPGAIDETKIPKKFIKPYKVLLEMREHVKSGLEMHTRDTLRRSSKDDSGDLSSYSQHMADAGTDTFDRDFALSQVSNEQDALFEIEEAIQRLVDGTYGVCEITDKPIAIERLMAVPFTRYSLEGQKQLEEQKKHSTKERGGVFAESTLEESAKYTNLETES